MMTGVSGEKRRWLHNVGAAKEVSKRQQLSGISVNAGDDRTWQLARFTECRFRRGSHNWVRRGEIRAALEELSIDREGGGGGH